MTVAIFAANATTLPDREPVPTPADDPATHAWERGHARVTREELLRASREKLNRLLRLSPGWDGHRALPPTPTAAFVLNGVLGELVTDDSATPQIAPLADRGLEVAWLVGGASLSVSVAEDGRVELVGERAGGDVVVDGDFDYWNADIALLGEAKRFLEEISRDLEVRVPTL